MAIISFTQLALLAFASVAIMRMFVKADTCFKSVGSCDNLDCNIVCRSNHLGGVGKCNETNTCNCYYSCPGKSNSSPAVVTPNDNFCTAAQGKCDAECDEPCCIHNCAVIYKGGVGHCDDQPRGGFKICNCDYPC